jgi:2C-methyl-D-erythritol 2,4-cyclodiphosphate synthase
MRLHPTLVEKFLQTCANQGGYSEESRLTKALANITLATYVLQNQPGVVLVEADKMIQARIDMRQPIHDIVPMKMHTNVIGKLLEMYRSYSGHSNESKLRAAFSSLDLTPYEVVSRGEAIVVLTKEYFEKLQQG